MARRGEHRIRARPSLRRRLGLPAQPGSRRGGRGGRRGARVALVGRRLGASGVRGRSDGPGRGVALRRWRGGRCARGLRAGQRPGGCDRPAVDQRVAADPSRAGGRRRAHPWPGAGSAVLVPGRPGQSAGLPGLGSVGHVVHAGPGRAVGHVRMAGRQRVHRRGMGGSGERLQLRRRPSRSRGGPEPAGRRPCASMCPRASANRAGAGASRPTWTRSCRCVGGQCSSILVVRQPAHSTKSPTSA